MRLRARVDSNQLEIVRTITGLGASWLDLTSISGILDGVIGVAGIDQRIEIKDGKKVPSRRKLTPDEIRVFEEWRGRKPVVIESVDDVIKLINNLRRTPHAPHSQTE